MLILSNTSSTLAIVTASAGAVSVHASYVDNNAGTITPAGANTASITSATTTTVVTSPSASIQRNVESLIVTNTSSTVSNQVSIQHFDGTTTATVSPPKAILAPGEMMTWVFGKGWTFYDANGNEKTTFASVLQTSVPFSSGTTLTLTSNNCYVTVTSTTAGNKTVTMAAATGSGGKNTVTCVGAITANAGTQISVSSSSTINGLATINIEGESLTFYDAAVGRWDSI
jgi:hypothetical protein